MTTRSELREQVITRLGDPNGEVWTVPELNDYLNQAIQSLYPYWPVYKVGTTTAGPGPVQTAPSGCRNIYWIGVKGATSTRVRTIRGWREGDGNAIVPKVNINGLELSWAWTEPHPAPTSDAAALTIPEQAEEVVVLRAVISALERVLSSKVKRERYYALHMREGVTEPDIGLALDALHESVRRRLERAPQPPERVG